MINVEVRMQSLSPYSQSKHYDTEEVPRLNEGMESHADYEKRTWKNRCHVNNNGNIIMPVPCFKLAMEAAAKYMNEKIPGKGNQTWSKKFTSGVMQLDEVTLPEKLDDVEAEWLFVPSDGKRGGGTRVNKCFPRIPEWEGMANFLVLDEMITEEVFKKFLSAAGQFIGVGRWRPERGGSYGRFCIKELAWKPNS